MSDKSNHEKIVNSIRTGLTLSQRKFNTDSLPRDMYRVYCNLKEKHNEEYALVFIFTMRTAIELHRAWHMTLFTSKILQQIKDKFDMKMTWELGVLKLKFRVNDGEWELHRKVPYDYDSEYQDIYLRIAIALIDGHIDVHEALIYQEETLQGLHSAKSGNFLRDFPGRLILYPLEAATCAVIFFQGDWIDGAIAALCGFASGIVEYILTRLGKDYKILIDVTVGFVTGLIGGAFHYFHSGGSCLSSVFLGTLYWYFYGTAFVISILEIIAGELETGVTRFVGVSIKTFVLSLGASLGLMIATKEESTSVWFESSDQNCGKLALNEKWWRIPLYLLCSASVLGQYRFPVVQYWRSLIVQLCAYEVQYQSFLYFSQMHSRDNLDTAASNILGAVGGVISACLVAYFTNQIRTFYTERLIQTNDKDNTKIGDFVFSIMKCFVSVGQCLRLGRDSDYQKIDFGRKITQESKELNDPAHPRQEIALNGSEENLILELVIGSRDVNVWSILMPAVYQLVPGSIIAKLWFNSIFPPLPDSTESSNSVFSNLMVISTSLALGIIIGFVMVQMFGTAFYRCFNCGAKSGKEHILALERLAGMYSAPTVKQDNQSLLSKESIRVNQDERLAENLSSEVDTCFPIRLQHSDTAVESGEQVKLTA